MHPRIRNTAQFGITACKLNCHRLSATDSMELRSWEACSCAASKWIPHFLWNPKADCCVQNISPLDTILSHTLTNPFLKIHLHITSIFTFTPRSPKWSFAFRFSDESSTCSSHLPNAYYMLRPSHLLYFDHPNNILWRFQVMKLLIMQFPPATFSLLCPDILLSNLFSYAINLCCFLNQNKVKFDKCYWTTDLPIYFQRLVYIKEMHVTLLYLRVFPQTGIMHSKIDYFWYLRDPRSKAMDFIIPDCPQGCTSAIECHLRKHS
jgi:hypothetical protein